MIYSVIRRWECCQTGCGGELDEGFGSDWNTRPIEDALNARIAELEALVERLIEAGDRLSDSLCTYPEEEKTIEVCNWNAIVAEYKECEK